MPALPAAQSKPHPATPCHVSPLGYSARVQHSHNALVRQPRHTYTVDAGSKQRAECAPRTRFCTPSAVSTQLRPKTRSCTPWNAEEHAMRNAVVRQQSPARAPATPEMGIGSTQVFFSPLFCGECWADCPLWRVIRSFFGS